MRLCVMRYWEQNKPVKLEQETKKATIYFFVSLSKLSNNFNEKLKITFYKIYENFLGIKLDLDVPTHIIVGITYLLFVINQKKKNVFNIIKKIIMTFLINYL